MPRFCSAHDTFTAVGPGRTYNQLNIPLHPPRGTEGTGRWEQKGHRAQEEMSPGRLLAMALQSISKVLLKKSEASGISQSIRVTSFQRLKIQVWYTL